MDLNDARGARKTGRMQSLIFLRPAPADKTSDEERKREDCRSERSEAQLPGSGEGSRKLCVQDGFGAKRSFDQFPSEAVDDGRHAGVGGAHQWGPEFDSPK